MADENYWRQIEEIFHQALENAPADRDAFLRSRCGGDMRMENEVREILAGFKEQDRVASSAADDAVLRFGAFEGVRAIGAGGMGVVYLGRRIGDFEQRAAIKVINGSPAETALLAERFRQERQILAGLDHPNIARLLDGGVSTTGRPYLVMEYVEGVRLDTYCDSQALSIAQRLELFRKVCAAVHYAHQNLVIHRDLKPGNILINEQGEPKLLDFGIAMMLSEPGALPEQTLTMTSRMLLTPQYASPEQVQGQRCTAATDIYSLGMILFELLAGQSPYASAPSSPAAWMAAVVTEEVRRPSLAAGKTLKSTLRGDLDGVVLRALAKKPEDRYGSVAEFSEDIRRYLEGLPVNAVEGTRWYVTRKFIGRHRLGVAAATLILLLLVGGLAATLIQARIAERERAIAEQRFSDARKLANYLLFPLYDQVQALPGSLPVRADMAAQSLQYLDRLSAAKSNDRALRLELGEGYVRLGTILEAPAGSGDSMGNTSTAFQSDRRAVELLEPLSHETPGDTHVRQDLARAYRLLGNVLNLRGKPDDGIAKLQQAVSIDDRLANTSRDIATLIEAGLAYVALGDTLSGRGGGFIEVATRDQVLPAADKAIVYFKKALNVGPADTRAMLGLAQAFYLKGNIVASLDPNQGFPIYEEGLRVISELPEMSRNQVQGQLLEARLLTQIAFCRAQTNHIPEALATFAQAEDILNKLAAADPKNAAIALRRVNLYRGRAMAHETADETPAALADYEKTVEMLDGMIAVDPAKQQLRLIRAECQGRIGKMLVKEGKLDEAMRYAKASIDFFNGVADRPDAAPQNLKEAVVAIITTPIEELNDYQRALGYAMRADKLSQGKDPSALFYIAQCYEKLGDGAKGLDAIQRGLALLPPTPAGQNPSRIRVLMEKHLRIIQVLAKTGKLPPGS